MNDTQAPTVVAPAVLPREAPASQARPAGWPELAVDVSRDAASSRARQLAQQATDAAEARAYATHPDVVALRLERVRTIVDRAMWAGIVLGLLFTMTNVQGFTARESGHSPGAAEITARLGWWSDWLLDPMVAAILIAILIAEQVTGRYRVELGGWVRFAKWFTLAATYLMNTWEAWSRVEPGLIVLHSVPPIAVFAAAEAAPRVRAGLTEAIERAHREVAAAQRAEKLPVEPAATPPPVVAPAPTLKVALAPVKVVAASVTAPTPAASVRPTPSPSPRPRAASSGDVDDDKARALVAQGFGKVRLGRALNITEHRAKQLIKAHSNGHQVTS